MQVVGSRHGTEGEHFYGLSRNLSVHGMLLASPVRIDAEDLDLEIDLPESEGRVRVLGRIAREAPEVGWPYVGYGIEFLFLPEPAQRVIDRLVRSEAPQEPPRSLWAPGADPLDPAPGRAGSTRSATPRAPRAASWSRSGAARATAGAPAAPAPSTWSRSRSPEAALEVARAFVHTPRLTLVAPRVSVLLPVRDAGATLDACLDSLAAQTLADHEVVAVDDGSTRRQPRASRRARAQAIRGCAW